MRPLPAIVRSLLVAPLLLLAPLAHAAWAPGGNPVCPATKAQFASSAVTDGAGGAIVAFSDGRVFAQHVNAIGLIPPGWATNGNPISSPLSGCFNAQAAPDGVGGAFVVWEDDRVVAGTDLYAQHVLASGALDPAWPAADLPVGVGPTNQYTHRVAPDGAGGVLVAWQDDRNDAGVSNLDIYIQRIDAGGTPLWTPNGSPVCLATGVQSQPKVTGDGLGGAYLAWIDERSGLPRVYAQHITAAGGIAPGWPDNGLAVANPGAVGSQQGAVVAQDGAGGVLVAWSGSNNQAVFHPFVMRIGAGGALAPGWPVAGAQLCNLLQTQDQVQVVSDLTGGAIVVWHDFRDVQNPFVNYKIYAQRVNGSGVRQWALNGVPVCIAPGSHETPAAVSDDQGGVVVTLQDGRGDGADIYGLRLTSFGARAPGWDVDGTALCVQLGSQQYPVMVPDGISGAIVAWTDGRPAPRFQASDVYANRTPDDVVVPVLASLLSASAQADRVAIAWQLPEAGVAARVWRRVEGEAWALIGDAVADAGGRLTFEDRNVRAGVTYDYRP